jgi:putative inorganic carbon (HCO3(-)) transporter
MLLYEVLSINTRNAITLLPFLSVFIIVLVVGVFLTKWGKVRDPDAPAKWKLGVILIAACIVLGFIGIEFIGRQQVTGGYGRFIYEAREILHGNIRDEMGSGRIHIWRNALIALPNFPIIGTGPDTFFYAFPAEAHGFLNQSYDKAHNEYLQILICQGIVGFLCYMVYLVGVLLKAIPTAFKNPLVMAVLAAFIGFCVQAFFNINLPIVSQSMWVFAGLMASKRFRETPLHELPA